MAYDLTKKLRLQHKIIKKILNDIQTLTNSNSESTTEISEKLKSFRKILVEHIHMENKVLYPKIFKNLENDRMGIKSINILLSEMKKIEEKTISFLNKYNNSKIKLSQFKTDLDEVSHLLTTRIKL